MSCAPLLSSWASGGGRWLSRKADLQEHDASALMWDVRRTVDARKLPDERLVVHFEFRGVPQAARLWWLLIEEDGSVDLCLKPPGHDVALSVVATLETMVDVWLGERALDEAVAAGDVRLTGDRRLQTTINEWLGSSLLAPTPRPNAGGEVH